MKERTIRKLFKFQPTVRLINHGDLTLLQMQSINSFWQSLQKHIPQRYKQNTSFCIGERGGINIWFQKYLLSPEMLPHLYNVDFLYFKVIVTETITEENQPKYVQVIRFRIFRVSRPLLQACPCAYCATTPSCAVPTRLQHHHNQLLQLLSPTCPQQPPFNIRYTFSFHAPYGWLLPSIINFLGFSGKPSCHLARNAALHLTPSMTQDYSAGNRVHAFTQNNLKYESQYIGLQAKHHHWCFF